MWRRVDLVWTDVSEERIAYIFRVEKSASEEPAWAGGCSLQVGSHKIYTAPHPRRRHPSITKIMTAIQCIDFDVTYVTIDWQ
jgi:hypothetical protein